MLNGNLPTPEIKLPDPADLQAKERLVIDFGSHDELFESSPLYQEIASHQSLVRAGGAS